MSITPLPAPPSRQDPNNFAERADELLAALVVFVTEANLLGADVSTQQTTASAAATTATTKAGEASSSRDVALAATNYKGLWSALSGALNIPATVLHSSSIWMLTQNVASVGAEVPGVSTKWINVSPASGLQSAAYQPTSAFQPAIGSLTGLLKSAGGGNIAAASAADIVAAIGAAAVTNATHATAADNGGVTSVNGLTGAVVIQSVPTGVVAHFAANSAPTGWLKANGASLSTTTYAALFSVIGYTFGGSGASFNLPDLRGEFIRGWSDGSTTDSGRAFGSPQTDDFESHSHVVSNYNIGINSGSTYTGLGISGAGAVTNSSAVGGAETRPRNIALLACIKY